MPALFSKKSASDIHVSQQKSCLRMRQGALKKSYLQGAFARPSHHMKRNCSELLTFKHTGFQMSNTIYEVIVIPTKYKGI